MRDSDGEDPALARAGAVLEIDLDALAGNWRRLAAEVGAGVDCAAVVKADAYGVGMAQAAPALWAAGCRLFFVATLEEGLALRPLLPAAEIAVLNGLPPLPGLSAELRGARLMPVLNDLGEIARWREALQGAPDPAMIHLDTGMARLGLPPAETQRLVAEPALVSGLRVRAVLSHLACADERDHPLNERQRTDFEAASSRLESLVESCIGPGASRRLVRSLAASFGLYLGAAYRFDLVRPGAALYGINPLPGRPNPMAQVVHLKGRILQVREVDSGATVGYGASHRMTHRGRVATIALGYADGWLRSSGNRGSVGIGGQRAPIIGRISMDLVTVDVSEIAPDAARPGAFASFLDADHTVDHAAAAAGTIGYEILTALGRRYHRRYRRATA